MEMGWAMNDPYESGTPKYSTAQDIYDSLCELVNTEEMGILSEMFSGVSYDNQGYYYTDKGYALKEKFDELIDYGNKMWIMDLAVWQIDQPDIHDLIYDALTNSDLAKRVGLKKLFIDHMLYGDKSDYSEIIEEYETELSDLNRFDNWEMIKAFDRVMQARGRSAVVTPYPYFCRAFCEKVLNLNLQNETRIISECRALLTSYDDFMYGLRSNQALYQQLELLFSNKAKQLKIEYDEKIRRVFLLAEQQGVVLEIPNTVKLISAIPIEADIVADYPDAAEG